MGVQVETAKFRVSSFNIPSFPYSIIPRLTLQLQVAKGIAQ